VHDPVLVLYALELHQKEEAPCKRQPLIIVHSTPDPVEPRVEVLSVDVPPGLLRLGASPLVFVPASPTIWVGPVPFVVVVGGPIAHHGRRQFRFSSRYNRIIVEALQIRLAHHDRCIFNFVPFVKVWKKDPYEELLAHLAESGVWELMKRGRLSSEGGKLSADIHRIIAGLTVSRSYWSGSCSSGRCRFDVKVWMTLGSM
jgi:hypothetical protein